MSIRHRLLIYSHARALDAWVTRDLAKGDARRRPLFTVVLEIGTRVLYPQAPFDVERIERVIGDREYVQDVSESVHRGTTSTL